MYLQVPLASSSKTHLVQCKGELRLSMSRTRCIPETLKGKGRSFLDSFKCIIRTCLQILFYVEFSTSRRLKIIIDLVKGVELDIFTEQKLILHVANEIGGQVLLSS